MKYRVRMMAFGDPGEVRVVDVPYDSAIREEILDDIFRMGQNEFQAQEHPSVSAGDVIEFGDKLILVDRVGFREITAEQFAAYERVPRRERAFYEFPD